MRIRVVFFAMGRELVGQDIAEVELPTGAVVADLRTALQAQFPAFAPLLHRSLIAVNHDYATDSTEIPEGAEVACIPPVSGGAPNSA